MILQGIGAAPVPKTSVTNITARVVDQRQQTQVNVTVPRLEDVVRTIADATLPAEGEVH